MLGCNSTGWRTRNTTTLSTSLPSHRPCEASRPTSLTVQLFRLSSLYMLHRIQQCVIDSSSPDWADRSCGRSAAMTRCSSNATTTILHTANSSSNAKTVPHTLRLSSLLSCQPTHIPLRSARRAEHRAFLRKSYAMPLTFIQRPQGLAVHLTLVSSAKNAPAKLEAYVGWTGMASASSLAHFNSGGASDRGMETVEIDPQYADGLGLALGDVVC